MRRLLVLPRLWVKLLMQRLHLASGMIEFCKDCGKRQPLVWHSNDALWERLHGDKGVLCPKCFDTRATRQGMLLYWIPVNRAGREDALAAYTPVKEAVHAD